MKSHETVVMSTRCKECETWVDPDEVFTMDGGRFHRRTVRCSGLSEHEVTCGPVAEVVVEQGKPWRWKDEPEKR